MNATGCSNIVCIKRSWTSLISKSTIFCIVTPYSSVEVHRYFEGGYHLHLQGRRVNEPSMQQEVVSKHSCVSVWLLASVAVHRRFEGLCPLHVQRRRVSKSRHQQYQAYAAACRLLTAGFFALLTFLFRDILEMLCSEIKLITVPKMPYFQD
jgi:hypothetical protein